MAGTKLTVIGRPYVLLTLVRQKQPLIGHLSANGSGCSRRSPGNVWMMSKHGKNIEARYVSQASSLADVLGVLDISCASIASLSRPTQNMSGETPENRNNIFQGHLDTVLSEEGNKQAELVGIKMQDEHFTQVFSSDLTRARKTAEAIINKSKCSSHMKIVEDARLRERCYGAVEGCTKELFLQMAADNHAKPRDFVPKGAETLDQVRDRVVECFNAIIHEIGSLHFHSDDVQDDLSNTHQVKNGFLCEEDFVNGDCKQPCLANILIVSHGGVIRELMKYFFDEFASDFPVSCPRKLALVSPNTGVSKFEIFINEQTKLPEFIKCLYFHNADHLNLSLPGVTNN